MTAAFGNHNTRPIRSRLWIRAAVFALYACDIALTLAGQSPAYWAGHHAEVAEANPVASELLSRSPLLFLSAAAVWLAFLSLVILFWRHRMATWIAFLLAVGHAVGGATWLVRLGWWGWLVAGVYLFAASQATAWCWSVKPTPTNRTDSE